MDEGDDPVNNENVRRTRSGKIVRTPASKAPAKKTRKKVVLMEVEVSEEEEEFQQNNTQKNNKEKVEEHIEHNVDMNIDNHDAAPEVQEMHPEIDIIQDNITSLETLEETIPEVEMNEEVIESGVLDEDSVALNELVDNTIITENQELSTDVVMETEFAEPINEESNGLKEIDEVIEAPEQQKNGFDVSNEVEQEEHTIQNEVEEQEQKTDEEEQEKNKHSSGEPDAENISEDELPTVQAVKVPETEEVSDEELPGPKRAELPADTEVVSEDELPTVKKEATKRKITEGDYDPGSPTSEGETPAKKASVESSVAKEEEKSTKPKKLPELDKYWKAVNDDPTDFTGWTYLLQYVDQENDMEAAREAYDAFLSHYPYCYGYWRKYADYEKRKGNKKKCEELGVVAANYCYNCSEYKLYYIDIVNVNVVCYLYVI